ncbi:hypothetical protein BDY21DRAFT_112304 [Lineolata rhizophorae]|uniref:Uncharacterized protein n=1 Tax=Lineolata rhizophorae TaxID=578093 RepID=A0A6A6NQT2_9PEZI|nr:hypothetical protein BDY21DRAFT_112304 [Lineolata rhizophorae]
MRPGVEFSIRAVCMSCIASPQHAPESKNISRRHARPAAPALPLSTFSFLCSIPPSPSSPASILPTSLSLSPIQQARVCNCQSVRVGSTALPAYEPDLPSSRIGSRLLCTRRPFLNSCLRRTASPYSSRIPFRYSPLLYSFLHLNTLLRVSFEIAASRAHNRSYFRENDRRSCAENGQLCWGLLLVIGPLKAWLSRPRLSQISLSSARPPCRTGGLGNAFE